MVEYLIERFSGSLMRAPQDRPEQNMAMDFFYSPFHNVIPGLKGRVWRLIQLFLRSHNV